MSLCEWRPRAASPRSSLICSVLSFFGGFGCPSLCPSAVAGVAAPLTSLAITVQLAQGQGFWGAGVLHWRRGFAGRPEVGSVNTFMRDGGCQLAIDTTLVCAMHCDGSPHQRAAERDGVVLTAAHRRKSAPRVGGTPQPTAFSGLGDGSWTQVVIRDLPSAFGQGTVSSRGTTPPETRRTGLAFGVGSHSGMCRCQGGRRVASGVVGFSWR